MTDSVPHSRPPSGLQNHPDRVAQWRRTPQLGPRILFFSGGTALRETSRCLKRSTHNSVHLVTPFDSGGSSAELRRCFSMPSIGDLRNRLVALADESMEGNPEIYRLFSHRFPKQASPADLRREFQSMVDGHNPLTAALPESLGRTIQSHLRSFSGRMDALEAGGPSGNGTTFDLRGASVGNLLLAAGYLDHERDLGSAVLLFSKLLQVRGQVHLISDADLHLACTLLDGSELVGQHRFGAGVVHGSGQRIESIRLVRGPDDPVAARASLTEQSREAIAQADLICFPMGSLFSSVIAPLLVDEVASCIEASGAPKIFVPNTGVDPEQLALSPVDAVEQLLKTLGRSLDNPRAVLDTVLLDTSDASYERAPDRDRLRQSDLDLVELPLVTDSRTPRIDPGRLVEFLLSRVRTQT